MEYKKFRVRTPVRSFRDLEVYKITLELSSQIYLIKQNKEKDKEIKENIDEFEVLYSIAKMIPVLIAESYGDRFTNLNLANSKMEKAMQVIASAIVKIDFVITLLTEQELKQDLSKIIQKYQRQRIKINNLKKAWNGVYSKNKNTKKQ